MQAKKSVEKIEKPSRKVGAGGFYDARVEEFIMQTVGTLMEGFCGLRYMELESSYEFHKNLAKVPNEVPISQISKP